MIVENGATSLLLLLLAPGILPAFMRLDVVCEAGLLTASEIQTAEKGRCLLDRVQVDLQDV